MTLYEVVRFMLFSLLGISAFWFFVAFAACVFYEIENWWYKRKNKKLRERLLKR